MKLHEAFNVLRGDVVAFIGAGGKTSTLIGLGHELAEIGWRVLATTTAFIHQDQLNLLPCALRYDSGHEAISSALTEHHFVFLHGDIIDGMVYGCPQPYIRQLMDTIDSDVLLVKADFADSRLMKAPLENEPLIPADTSLVIPVASLSVLGQPFDDEHVYNLKAIHARYGFPMDKPIKSPWLAQVLRDETLGLRGVPEGRRIVAFLNRTPTKGYGRARARLVARLALRKSRLYGVAIGSVRGVDPVHEVRRPIGAIILAAGMSTRMGEHKVLLPWTKEKTIIEHIIDQLMRSRIDHITVVTGHMSKEVKAIVEPLGVKVVFNRGYKSGEMLSSLKAGLRSMPDNVATTFVVLGDQPRIQPRVLYQLSTMYAQTGHDLIAPSFEHKRGHPLLIGRRYWTEILGISRQGSLRDVMKRYADDILYVNVNTDSILRDVDTPDDYEQERLRAGLGRYD